MPGIYGYTKSQVSDNFLPLMTSSLCEITSTNSNDEINDDLIQTSHLFLTNSNSEQISSNGIHVLIEGEKYNYSNISFKQLLTEAYLTGQLKSVLAEIDGLFNALIYDNVTKKIHLISDRYGMKFLYYCFENQRLSWSQEVKALLALPFISKDVDPIAVDSFLELGYVLEDRSLFSNIKLIKPASIMTFDLSTKTLTEEHYWKWSAIKSRDITFEQATEELGKLFLDAVKKRFDSSKKMGITLSGGLDSRAIVAAVTTLYPDYKGTLSTFGIEGCDDIEIAKIVARKTNWNHKIYHFKAHNWFEPRFDSIWRTDGMLSMEHMHGSEFLDDIAKEANINLNGYAGDVVCGGGWFKLLPLNTRAKAEGMRLFYKNQTDKTHFDSDFYDLDKSEPHLFMNRVRRFTNMGTVNSLDKIEQRKPFFDNALMEFALSIPDEYRKDNKLYAAMLLKFFPDFFTDIPWQKTRKTILGEQSQYLKSENIIRGYINYAREIREDSILTKINDLLSVKGSKYSEFTDIDAIEEYLTPHLVSFKYNYVSEIFRFLTLEYYLRKVATLS
ncbi:asparagine synthase-related protein [Aliiglaciecola sp. 3_MG-2023]|uniref:asparagine synthase-related protein n=1 Tax=Aliiglaciecola sp. 3_MG-2023 TaxID=3062644 RepID=UPI0026E33E1A|nr:asparagine synthase-related protein [Aliiglaciecola sp. 3_MG-2023]MDO6691724.1 asparagine synthase-related protein [Aliiglaciecola sp. 3_MG-2023]